MATPSSMVKADRHTLALEIWDACRTVGVCTLDVQY